MSAKDPWSEYDRDKLLQGWAYPVGLDDVRTALASAGATIGSLSFARAAPGNNGDQPVIGVHWPSDAVSRLLGGRERDADSLMMWVTAVRSAQRLETGRRLRAVWLGRAAAWALQAPGRGNAWTSMDHWWTLVQKPNGRLDIEVS